MNGRHAIADQAWGDIQARINMCSVCVAFRRPLGGSAILQHLSVPPARPRNPGTTGRLLLVAEAPPLLEDGTSAGGFWRDDTPDALRDNLLGLLVSGSEGLRRFLDDDLFLIHTIKWPIIDEQGRATNYAGLHPINLRRDLLKHTVDEHLRPELELLKPGAILAMGDAARTACSYFLGGAGLRRGTLASHRERDCAIRFGGREVRLGVTWLPVDRNRDKRPLIHEDITRFLEKHAVPGGDGNAMGSLGA